MNNANKHVNFNTSCDVILIPSNNEYSDIKSLLWWNSNDYTMMTKTYLMDLDKIINENSDTFEVVLLITNKLINKVNMRRLAKDKLENSLVGYI